MIVLRNNFLKFLFIFTEFMKEMSCMKNIINNVINGTSAFCCLCLQLLEEPFVLLKDETFIEKTVGSLEIIEILEEILDDNILDLLSPENALCRNCKKSAIDGFRFVRMCKENCRILEKITNNIYNTINVLNAPGSVFITVDIFDFTTRAYYDREKPFGNIRSPLRKFRNLLEDYSFATTIEEEEYDIDTAEYKCADNIHVKDGGNVNFEPPNVLEKTKKVYTKTGIPTSEMMYDNDCLKCKNCLRSYKSKQHLRQHFIRVHAPKRLPCGECHRSFSTQALLDYHKKQCHTPIVCSQCGKSYKNRFTLAHHEQGHYMKIICPDCGRVYKNRKTFNAHVELKICQQKQRKSNSQGTYICDDCGKKFCHKSTLRVHIKFEHGTGKPHVCPWCSKKFCADSRLKAHIVKHTKEKRFSCDVCGGKFVTKESLRGHIRIHTGERPYSCHLCDLNFLTASRRAAHVRKHLALSYECDICQSKFRAQTGLLNHRKKHFNPKSRLHCSKIATTSYGTNV